MPAQLRKPPRHSPRDRRKITATESVRGCGLPAQTADITLLLHFHLDLLLHSQLHLLCAPQQI